MNKLQTMNELLAHDIQMLYSAETLGLEAQKLLAESATDSHLKSLFTLHERESQKQVARLEKIMVMMDLKPSREVCSAVKGLMADTEKLLNKESAPEVLDAMLIGAAQKMEHYEIACYGTAVWMTEDLGMTQVADLLRQTLAEEKQANELLNEVAKQRVNPKAEMQA
ncbi:ferritin-like domain-containing protein [Hymenobacter saemangeumensis]|uniref:Ferritin-like domain-containing protein n=1 Tax=Hymenobacter saemangeumensis TaxID=1084522 RepID=A0ABP8IQP5_9BACT